MDELGAWVVQLRKGVVELLVLRILRSQGELHGYAIVRELQAVGRVIAGESTVYPVLKRLEADGMVEADWVPTGAGPPRKYYRITQGGRRFLDRANEEWDALVETMRSVEGDGNE